MGLFGKGKDENPDSETPMDDVSGLDSPEQVSAALEKGRTIGKRGRKPGSTNQKKDEVNSMQKEFDALFQPEEWEDIAAAPYEIMASVTGDSGFQLEQKAVKKLSVATALVAKYFLGSTKPEFVALGVWAMLNVRFMGAKWVSYQMRQKKVKKPENLQTNKNSEK